MMSISTAEILSEVEVDSENVARLKITVRKGARIESVPKKKLEKLATNQGYIGSWKMSG